MHDTNTGNPAARSLKGDPAQLQLELAQMPEAYAVGHFARAGAALVRSTPRADCNAQGEFNLESIGRKVAHR